MNEEQTFKRLFAAARSDKPPAIDVADWVMEDISTRREPGRVLMWVYAAVSSAAAAVVAAVALRLLTVAEADPFSEFLQSTMAVMQ